MKSTRIKNTQVKKNNKYVDLLAQQRDAGKLQFNVSNTYHEQSIERTIFTKESKEAIMHFLFENYPDTLINIETDGSQLKRSYFQPVTTLYDGKTISYVALNKLLQRSNETGKRQDVFRNLLFELDAPSINEEFIFSRTGNNGIIYELVPIKHKDDSEEGKYKRNILQIALLNSEGRQFSILFNPVYKEEIYDDFITLFEEGSFFNDSNGMYYPIVGGDDDLIFSNIFTENYHMRSFDNEEDAVNYNQSLHKLIKINSMTTEEFLRFLLGFSYFDNSINQSTTVKYFRIKTLKFVKTHNVKKNNYYLFPISLYNNQVIEFNMDRYDNASISGYLDFTINTIEPNVNDDGEIPVDQESSETDAIDYFNNIDLESKTQDVIRKLLDSNEASQEAILPVLNKLIKTVSENELYEFTQLELDSISNFDPEVVDHIKKLNIVKGMTIQKALSNVSLNLESYKEKFSLERLKNVKQPQDILSIAQEISRDFVEYENQFNEMNQLSSYSKFEEFVTKERNNDRPILTNDFDDFEVSLVTYLKNLRAWILRKVSDVKEDKFLEFINKILSANIKNYLSSKIDNIAEFLLNSLKTMASNVLVAAANALSIIDDVYHFITKTRLPLSFNRNWDVNTTVDCAKLTSNGGAGFNFVKQGKKNALLFLPDYSGKKFGNKYWNVNNMNSPFLNHNEIHTKDPMYIKLYNSDEFNTAYGWLCNINYLASEELNEHFKVIKKISKKFPYLGYATLLKLSEQKFHPNFTVLEEFIAATSVALQASVASVKAALSTHGLIARVIAAIAAAVTVVAINTASAVIYKNQFSGDLPDLLSDNNPTPKISSATMYIPNKISIFLPWSSTKWAIEIAKSMAGVAAAFAGSVAIGALGGKVGSIVYNSGRKRKLKKAYLKPKRERRCEMVERKGSIKEVCKNVKLINDARKIKLPNGETVTLNKQEMYEKIAFDTFITYKNSSGTGNINFPSSYDKQTGDEVNQYPVGAEDAGTATLNILKTIISSSKSVEEKQRILNKKLGLEPSINK